ncbi:sigma-70 family RNA polymerase sigma factor [Actinoplanes sp. NPDC051633]|uniref:RNA polymerase sigma factor n=1 Tax=Actinoplanes sp. NPDC051633 TaxID=3155670 RepID=UPI003430DDC7
MEPESAPSLPPDPDLVERLRRRDDAAFAAVLDAWSTGMLRVARGFVSTAASAEEVVQETWLAVIQGLDGFAGRSSLKTWVFRILVNTAKRRGAQESRTVPWSGLPAGDDAGPTVDPSRFLEAGHEWAGPWREFPAAWPRPDQAALDREIREQAATALAGLPERHRVVITLRDVEGYSSDQVCVVLEISPANQRVLLHRARAAVRAELERYFAGAEAEVMT